MCSNTFLRAVNQNTPNPHWAATLSSGQSYKSHHINVQQHFPSNQSHKNHFVHKHFPPDNQTIQAVTVHQHHHCCSMCSNIFLQQFWQCLIVCSQPNHAKPTQWLCSNIVLWTIIPITQHQCATTLSFLQSNQSHQNHIVQQHFPPGNQTIQAQSLRSDITTPVHCAATFSSNSFDIVNFGVWFNWYNIWQCSRLNNDLCRFYTSTLWSTVSSAQSHINMQQHFPRAAKSTQSHQTHAVQ